MPDENDNKQTTTTSKKDEEVELPMPWKQVQGAIWLIGLAYPFLEGTVLSRHLGAGSDQRCDAGADPGLRQATRRETAAKRAPHRLAAGQVSHLRCTAERRDGALDRA